MKYLIPLFITLLTAVSLNGQSVDRSREAELMPEDYSIAGLAFLEELDNGDVQLRLSDDFDTPAGPDVRILLSNSLSLSGAIEIVNLSDIGHFEGELTVPVSSLNIEDYDFILFYCVSFQQFWASGELGDIMVINDISCYQSTVGNANGNNNIDICPSDGTADVVEFENSLGLDAGDEYAYLITDNNENLEAVVMTDEYDFEGSNGDGQRVYGLHYTGDLDIQIGSNRTATTASDCYVHSDGNSYIQITKDACPSCEESEVANISGFNIIDICASDNIDDIIELENNLDLNPGNEYVYLLTDEEEILTEVLFEDMYNFEGTGDQEQRIYGLNYSGSLNIEIGDHRTETTASGCHEHSSDDNYITITKNACTTFDCINSETYIASTTNDTVRMINICPIDGIQDSIIMRNSINESTDGHYAYILTNTQGITQSISVDSVINFEGTGLDTQLIYGIHFDGTLIPSIGQDRRLTSATGCFVHSDNTNFITIIKNACAPDFECLSSTVSSAGTSTIDICADDGQNDIITLNNSLNISAGIHYAYLITDNSDILQEVVFDNNYNFEGSSQNTQRVYGLHYDGTLIPAIGQARTATTATGCFNHSQPSRFITITKNACAPDFECLSSTVSSAGNSTIDICADDGQNDIITLNNSLNLSATGTNYAYLITDNDEIVQQVILSNSVNLEGSSQNTQRVYGVHYDGTLIPAIGQVRTATTATGCHTHSEINSFLTVTKNACTVLFECRESLTATTDWATSIDVCTSDGIDDIIELRNSIFETPGEHYAYLITDVRNILQEVTTDSLYNFEGTSNNEQRVYGIHYDGNLMPAIGEDRLQTIATGCYIHSGSNLFLTINKIDCAVAFECQESITATTNWVTEVDICAGDGEDDLIELRNNIQAPVGGNYAFLITDEFENLQEVFFDTLYNFENSGTEEQRIYGISYDGELSAQIGDHRRNTTASNCYIHSGDNLFITINKSAACNITSTEEEISFAENINVFPNPSTGVININTDKISEPIDSMILYDINGKIIQEINNKIINITQPGFYLLKVSSSENNVIKKIIVQ